MKIFHISDLHLDTQYKRSNYIKTCFLLEQITAEGFDHLIISGDITENAETPAFELARKLLKKYELLNSSKTTIVIGNHDIYGGVHFAEDVISFPSKCRETDYDKKVKEFEHYFRETFNNTIAPLKNTFFPFIKEFDDFVLIGLNSIAKYSVLRNPFASNGEIKPEQIAETEKLLSNESFKNKKRIVITHHHFSKEKMHRVNNSISLWKAIEFQTMRLKSKKKIMKQLKNIDVELIIHGHKHRTMEYQRKGLKFLNSGGSVLGHRPNEIKIIEINITGSEILSKVRTFYVDNLSPVSKNFRLPFQFRKSVHTPKEISLN